MYNGIDSEKDKVGDTIWIVIPFLRDCADILLRSVCITVAFEINTALFRTDRLFH